MISCYQALERLVEWLFEHDADVAAGIAAEIEHVEELGESFKWEPTQAQLLEWHVQDDGGVQHAIVHPKRGCTGCFCCTCHVCKSSVARFELFDCTDDESVHDEDCLCNCHCWWRVQ